MIDPPPDVAYAAAFRCWTCGRMVRCRVQGIAPKHHGCRFRWLSRQRWASYLEGWHEGYRWAVEHPDDPLVLADADDYGTGWAGHMRVGHLTIAEPTETPETP